MRVQFSSSASCLNGNTQVCDDISAFKLLLLLFAFPNITVISYILMCVHTRERDSSPGIDGV